MQDMTTIQALTQGLTFKKSNLKTKQLGKVKKFTADEGLKLTQEDKDLLFGSLKNINTHSKLKDKKIKEGKSDEEKRTINRFLHKVSYLEDLEPFRSHFWAQKICNFEQIGAYSDKCLDVQHVETEQDEH